MSGLPPVAWDQFDSGLKNGIRNGVNSQVVERWKFNKSVVIARERFDPPTSEIIEETRMDELKSADMFSRKPSEIILEIPSSKRK